MNRKLNILKINSTMQGRSKDQQKNKNRKKENVIDSGDRPMRPIPKQFQLLYRTRDNLPSKQAYESLIFMKSKKCQQSTSRSRQNFQNINPTTSHLRNMIRSLQKKIKIHENSELKINNKQQKKSILKKQSTIPRWSQATSRNRNNTKKCKSKSPNHTTKSQTLKESHKRKIEVSKENIKGKILIPISEDYILIGDSFIQISKASVSQLEHELHQFYQQSRISPSHLNIKSHFEQSNGHQESELELESVKDYLTSKAIIIQMWWRKILQRKNNRIAYPKSVNTISSNGSYRIISGSRNIQEMGLNVFEEIKSTKQQKQEKQGKKDQENQNCLVPPSSTPTLLAQQLNCKTILSDSGLQLRQHAASVQMATHKNIIEKLFANSKIKQNTYQLKLKQIEENYQKQLNQIEQIKQILQRNAQKVQRMVQKTKEDAVMAEINDDLTEEEILNKLFKKEDVIHGREKSTGCHYNPASIRHFFSKQQREQFSQEEDEEELSISKSQELDFYQENFNNQQFNGNTDFHLLLEQYKQRQNVKNEIDTRVAAQMGIIIPQTQLIQTKNTINTSISAIHNFLVSFFKFYTYYNKDSFLRFINMPYGYSPKKRLAYMQNYEGEIDEDEENGIVYGVQNVISKEMLEDFYEHYYQKQDMNESYNQTIEFQKIHNNAVFDAFNEGLNHFRPYFSINGPPYSWNNSEKALTFYFIAQDNIREVFEKTQFKLLKWSSCLCGIIINKLDRKLQNSEQTTLQKVISQYRECTHPVVVENRQEKLFKTQKIEVQETNYQWFLLDQQKTTLLYQLSSLIMEHLSLQIEQQLMGMGNLEFSLNEQSFNNSYDEGSISDS